MPHVIDWGVVEKHLVLCRCATTYLETAGGVAFRLHTRQQLDRAHDVVLAKQLRCGCQVLNLQHFSTCLHILDALTCGVGGDDNLLQPLAADGVGVFRETGSRKCGEGDAKYKHGCKDSKNLRKND